MSRGEMIRRLDEAAGTAVDVLANGPLTPEEQHAIAATLAKLLPLVADSLQKPRRTSRRLRSCCARVWNDSRWSAPSALDRRVGRRRVPHDHAGAMVTWAGVPPLG
jgi:hypothetical protein